VKRQLLDEKEKPRTRRTTRRSKAPQ